MLDKWHKKEKPVFTGITRGVGGFGFGSAGGGSSGPPPITATGGDATVTADGFKTHFFTTTGASTFVVDAGTAGQIDVFVVAGGGGGGCDNAGGGGAGGVRSFSFNIEGPYSASTVVGAGGAGDDGPEDGTGDLVEVDQVKPLKEMVEQLQLLLMDDHQRFRVMLVAPLMVKVLVEAVVPEVLVKMVKHQVLTKVATVA